MGLIIKFSDLLKLGFNKNTNIIDIDDCLTFLPNTPISVAKQWYSDHGRKEEFQEQYNYLNIQKISWSLLDVEAEKLVESECYEDFRSFVSEKEQQVIRIAKESLSKDEIFRNLHHLEDIRNFWIKNRTWFEPPVFIEGSAINASCEFRLVEGHTRLGVLMGLVKAEIIPANSLHKIYFGRL